MARRPRPLFLCPKHFTIEIGIGIGIGIGIEGKRLQLRCRYFGMARECIDIPGWRTGQAKSIPISIPGAVGEESRLFYFHPAHPFFIGSGWIGDGWNPACDFIEEGKENGIQFILGAAKGRAI
ncbi:MAG: hypothetical protein LR011_07255 [Verrucomicrobia bacterium]|nr:hypothetical protein [Verrucomicrobiota bacterium]